MLTLATALAGCGQGASTETIESPAGPGSLAPRWSAPAGEAPLLSWLEPAGDGHALRYARLVEGEFSAPVTVVTGTDWFANWADTPSVVLLPEGRLAAHWLVKNGPGPYHYDVRMAVSTDRGATWRGYFNAHEDGTQTEHGFAQLFAEPGAVGAVWLDGRHMVADGPMSLRYGRFGAAGEVLDATQLDDQVCECCITGAARTAAGLVVVYRDRTEDEIRDIYRVVRTEDGWSEPAPVAADGWRINACPVNGPAVAAAGDRVTVAWFTAAGGVPAVKLAFSENGGLRFGDPVVVDGTDPAGRVDVVLGGRAGAWVSWLDAETQPARLRLQRFEAGRPTGEAITVAEPGSARASGFPVMAPAGEDLLLAWTQADAGIRVARVALP